jgi:hypothetical protein
MRLDAIIEPRCKVPTYLQTDIGIVERCGEIGGYISSVVVTLIILFLAYGWYSKSPTPLSNPPSQEDLDRIKSHQHMVIGITLIGLVLIWVGTIAAYKFFARREWEGYQHEVDSLVSQGYDRKGAIAQVQALRQTEVQADAIRYAGDRIGNSMGKSRTTIGTESFQISF